MTAFRQSPNYTKNRVIVPEAIILHHSAGNFAGSLSWILNPSSKVSYHCLVNLNGERFELLKDTQRGWHAGASSLNGRKNCNDFSLGIAVSGDTYKRKITKEEILSVAGWCVDKMRKFRIPIEMVVTHRFVSPERRYDVSPEAEEQILNKIKTLLNAAG